MNRSTKLLVGINHYAHFHKEKVNARVPWTLLHFFALNTESRMHRYASRVARLLAPFTPSLQASMMFAAKMKTSYATVITCLAQVVLAIQNPIITGFNPDPAILRLGNEYFIATSSFEFFPGFPIYKSTDLQNWELYSHALTRPSQLQLYGTPGSAGV
jgi:hypothetical protein